MAVHAENALGGAGVSQVVDLALTVAAPEAAGAKGLVAREDGQVLDLAPACRAAVRAVVADQGTVAE